MISSMEARFCNELNVISTELDEPFIRVFVFFSARIGLSQRESPKVSKSAFRETTNNGKV